MYFLLIIKLTPNASSVVLLRSFPLLALNVVSLTLARLYCRSDDSSDVICSGKTKINAKKRKGLNVQNI